MKQIAITGKKECAVLRMEEPSIKENFVKVKIHVAPMCTEFKSYLNGDISDRLGHEAAGEVVEVAQPGRVKVGDRVVVMPQYSCGKCDLCVDGDYIYCQDTLDPLKECDSKTGIATYSQYCVKQDWLLMPIPDEVSYEQASMACCGLGPSFGAMQNMNVSAFDTVLVAGMGPVGLGAVINGVMRNARVIALEGGGYRAELARKLGAEAVIDPADPDALDKIKSLTNGRGVDKAIDCCAVPAAQAFLVKATRRRGHITFVGWGGHLELGNMIPDGLTLQGSWHWNLRDTPKMLKLINRSASLIDVMITHRFGMDDVKEAFELQATGRCGKVLLHPWK